MLEDEIKELEKLGKPIIHYTSIEKYNFELLNIYVIVFKTKNSNNNHNIRSVSIEEKEGILITDDFIFIKD